MFNHRFNLKNTVKREKQSKDIENENKKEEKKSLKRTNSSEDLQDLNKRSRVTHSIENKKYEILEELASKDFPGAKGKITRSVCLSADELNKLFVLKVHKGLDTSDTSIKAAIEREVRIITKTGLSVQSADNIASDGSYSTLEDFIPGKNLFTILEAEKKALEPQLSLKKKIEIGIKIVDALQRLHDLRVLHRDIKLENILYDEGNEKITFVDFELSLEVGDDLKTIADFKFTPGLVPPELLTTITEDGKGYQYSNKSDIFLLGIALGEWFGVINQLMDTPRSQTNLFKPKTIPEDLQKTIPIVKAMMEDDSEKRDPLSETREKLQKLVELVATNEAIKRQALTSTI